MNDNNYAKLTGHITQTNETSKHKGPTTPISIDSSPTPTTKHKGYIFPRTKHNTTASSLVLLLLKSFNLLYVCHQNNHLFFKLANTISKLDQIVSLTFNVLDY
jgi:hypothetical protein